MASKVRFKPITIEEAESVMQMFYSSFKGGISKEKALFSSVVSENR
jgi:hypothetical protein